MFEDLLATFATLGGLAALISVLINIGKTVGIIHDGQAPTWSTALNLAGLIALFVLQLLGKSDLVPALDSQAGALASVLTAIFGFVWQLIVSLKAHGALKGAAIVGKSFSLERATDKTPSEYAG